MDRYALGQLVRGTITQLTDFGAFARLDDGIEGLIHVSELAEGRVTHPRNVVSEGTEVTLRVIRIDPQRRRMGLSLKRAMEAQEGDILPPQEPLAPVTPRAEGDNGAARGGNRAPGAGRPGGRRPEDDEAQASTAGPDEAATDEGSDNGAQTAAPAPAVATSQPAPAPAPAPRPVARSPHTSAVTAAMEDAPVTSMASAFASAAASLAAADADNETADEAASYSSEMAPGEDVTSADDDAEDETGTPT
jgi:predicted RNA-binding protein with RPS1 domain